MKGYKFEILRDDDGAVRGYKLGNHYLIKHYVWANDYEWIINKDGKDYYYANEIFKLHDAGEIEWASSCKEGKKRLIELMEKEA